MMNGIIDPMVFDTLIPMHYNDNHPCYDQQVGYLYSLDLHIYAKLKACLIKMEDDIKVIRIVKRDDGWDQYLSILKQLHYISQLYKGAKETFWTNLWPHKVAFGYLIVKFAKRADEDYKWILDRTDYLTVESRRHLVMMLLPDVTQDYMNDHNMLINRLNLLAKPFESISQANLASLHGLIFIQFTNEEATRPGVFREWFMLVCQAIFNPQNSLFLTCLTDQRTFFPNPVYKVNPLHLEYYRFAGRVIALALMHNTQVGIVFGRAFFLQLARINVSLEYIKDADPYLYSCCKQILEMDPYIVD
uniref:HECT-type E3 ubiquitin transferase n=1 Tax=Tanacetum cinerariifolium TaxID=118510 RepID=A0A699JUY8_TANCI|nr:E3 ubiquitin-protein ligase UPL5-like [Tanacetum cinerariifolium]